MSEEHQEKRGRPTLYTEEVAAEICRRLSLGETLNQICRDDHLPSRPTVIDWVLQDREGFSDRYTQARMLLLDHWADEVVEISDDGSNDWMERESKRDAKESKDDNVQLTLNSEHINRSRLRVDTRKWLLSKLKPEQYGDRTTQTHDISDNLKSFITEISSIDGNEDIVPSNDQED